MRLYKTACVTHQAAGDSEIARLVDRGNRLSDSQGSKLFTVRGEKAIGGNHESASSQLEQRCEHGIEVSFGIGVQDMELQPQGGGRPLQVPQL
jgi:hypothetical protein